MFTQPRPKRTYASKKNNRTLAIHPRNVFKASESTFNALSISNIRKAKRDQSYIANSSKYSPTRLKKKSAPTQNITNIWNSPSLEITPEYKSSNITPDVSIHLKRNSLDAFDKLLMESPKNTPAIIAINTSDLDPSVIEKINISSDSSSMTPHSQKIHFDTSGDSEEVLSPRKVRKKRCVKKKNIKPVFRNLTNKDDSETVYNHSLEFQKYKTCIKSDSARLDSLKHDSHFKDILQGIIHRVTPCGTRDSKVLVCDVSQRSGHSACRNKNCPSNNLSRRMPTIIPFSSTPLKELSRKPKNIENISPISIIDSPLPTKLESFVNNDLPLNCNSQIDMEASEAISNIDICKRDNKSLSDTHSKSHDFLNENSLLSPPPESESKNISIRVLQQEENIERLAEKNPTSPSYHSLGQYELDTSLKDRCKTLYDEPYLIGFTSQAPVLLINDRNYTASPDMFDSTHNIFQNMSKENLSPVDNSLVNDINQDSPINNQKEFNICNDTRSTSKSTYHKKHSCVSTSDIENVDNNDSNLKKSSSINHNTSGISFSVDNHNESLQDDLNTISLVSATNENVELLLTKANSIDQQFYDSLENINENHNEIFESYKDCSSSEDSSRSSRTNKEHVNSSSFFVTRRKNMRSDECKSFAQLHVSSYAPFISFNSSEDNDTCNIKEYIDNEVIRQNNLSYDNKKILENEKFDEDLNSCDRTQPSNETLLSTESEEEDTKIIKRRSSICLRTRRVVCNMFRKPNIKSSRNKKPIKVPNKINMSIEEYDKVLQANSDTTNTNSSRDSLEDHVFAVPAILPIAKKVRNVTDFSDEERNLERPSFVLQPGKRWERSLSILKRMSMLNNTMMSSNDLQTHTSPSKGRMSRDGITSVLKLQHNRDCRLDTMFESLNTTTKQAPSRRLTIRIVQENNQDDGGLELLNEKDLTTLIPENNLTGFLSDTCNDTLINLSRLSLSATDCNNPHFARRKFLDETIRVRPTARDVVLTRCNQDYPLPFDVCFPDEALKHCRKIGEGVYGEVFMYRPPDDHSGSCAAPRVMKVIPVEGDLIVNGEHQKKFEEILSEIVIAMELSALRSPKCTNFDKTLVDIKDKKLTEEFRGNNCTEVFSRVCGVRCVSGTYPQRLLDLWELYDETKGSENDNPSCFSADQLYIVLELENGGDDLEAFVFNNAEQARSVFDQVAIALAVAERTYQFEHRDLHWGNILVKPTDSKFGNYTLDGASYSIPLCGVQATIIDYTLSRLTLPANSSSSIQTTLFNELSADDELFDAVGDYQYEIYRLMKKKNNNIWKIFEPYTNVLWLHYTLDKMITALRYKRTNSNIHKHSIAKLTELKDQILEFGSAQQFVSVCYENFIA